MHRNVCRITCVLSILFLLTAVAAAVAENGPEPPVDPTARQAFVPGPPAPEMSPATPWLPHPKADGQAVPGSLPAVVRFADLAQPSLPEAEGPVRSHVQGEALEAQGGVDFLHSAATWPTEAIDTSQPKTSGALVKSLGRVATSFDGLTATGWIPPDTVMAPGPNHVVEAVNAGFAVYSKSGSNLVGYTTFVAFFAPVTPVGWAGFMFDPRILYSVENGKFVMLTLGIDQVNMTSYFFIAVSQSSDPTGAWWIWCVNTNSGFTPDAWLDFAGLGADTWGIYVTGNYFYWIGGYKYSTIISLNPAMFTGGSSNGWQFVDLQWPSSSHAFSVQPALPLSVAGGQETFFVNSWSGFGSQLLLWTLTGDRTNSPNLARAVVNVNSYSALGENVDQPGSATDIDGGDARIMNAFYAQRRLYTTLTNDTNGNATSSGAFLAKLNVDSHLSEWNVTLDGGSGWYYFFPAVAIGDAVSTSPPVSVFLSWTYPALVQYASAAVKTYAGPPADTSGPFPSIAFGLGPYVALDSNNRNRWGDYSGAGFDFSTETVWGAAEYAGAANTWRTRIAQLGGIFADGFESGDTSAWSSTSP